MRHALKLLNEAAPHANLVQIVELGAFRRRPTHDPLRCRKYTLAQVEALEVAPGSEHENLEGWVPPIAVGR